MEKRETMAGQVGVASGSGGRGQWDDVGVVVWVEWACPAVLQAYRYRTESTEECEAVPTRGPAAGCRPWARLLRSARPVAPVWLLQQTMTAHIPVGPLGAVDR